MGIIADAVNKIILDTAQNLHMPPRMSNSSADAVQATQEAAQNLHMSNSNAQTTAQTAAQNLHVQTSGAASGAANMKDSYTQTSGAASGAAIEQTSTQGKCWAPKSRRSYLWTKRGIARLCKMYDSPLAWAAFTALENNYFAKIETPASATSAPPVVTPVVESAPPPKPYELPDIELSIRERIDILSKCLDYTDSKNLRNKIITDIAYLVTHKIY